MIDAKKVWYHRRDGEMETEQDTGDWKEKIIEEKERKKKKEGKRQERMQKKRKKTKREGEKEKQITRCKLACVSTLFIIHS